MSPPESIGSHGPKEPSKTSGWAVLVGLAGLAGLAARCVSGERHQREDRGNAQKAFERELEQVREQVRTRALSAVGTVLSKSEYGSPEELIARLPHANLRTVSDLVSALVTVTERVHVRQVARENIASGEITISLGEITQTVRSVLRKAVESGGQTLVRPQDTPVRGHHHAPQPAGL